MSGMFKPKIPPPPAPPPDQPEIKPAETKIGGSNEMREELRNKRGRNSLRIDPQSGGVNSKGGAGINVPMK